MSRLLLLLLLCPLQGQGCLWEAAPRRARRLHLCSAAAAPGKPAAERRFPTRTAQPGFKKNTTRGALGARAQPVNRYVPLKALQCSRPPPLPTPEPGSLTSSSLRRPRRRRAPPRPYRVDALPNTSPPRSGCRLRGGDRAQPRSAPPPPAAPTATAPARPGGPSGLLSGAPLH